MKRFGLTLILLLTVVSFAFAQAPVRVTGKDPTVAGTTNLVIVNPDGSLNTKVVNPEQSWTLIRQNFLNTTLCGNCDGGIVADSTSAVNTQGYRKLALKARVGIVTLGSRITYTTLDSLAAAVFGIRLRFSNGQFTDTLQAATWWRWKNEAAVTNIAGFSDTIGTLLYPTAALQTTSVLPGEFTLVVPFPQDGSIGGGGVWQTAVVGINFIPFFFELTRKGESFTADYTSLVIEMKRQYLDDGTFANSLTGRTLDGTTTNMKSISLYFDLYGSR